MITTYFSLMIILAIIIFLYRGAIKTPNLAVKYALESKPEYIELHQRGRFTEIIYAAFPYVIILAIIKSLFFDLLVVPSGSMLPGIHVNTRIFVNKSTLGIRSPLTGAPMTMGRYPLHGEVVVTKFPLNPDILYVKRVVGLPGDSVSLTKEALVINNNKYPLKHVERRDIKKSSESELVEHDFYSIKINNIDYKVIVKVGEEFPGFEETVLPEETFFLLGDNLTASGDSRLFGPVPWSYFVGSVM